MIAAWRNFVSILRGIVDELSDQSAYARHLQAHGATHSPQEWRRFQDELWVTKSRRPRCC